MSLADSYRTEITALHATGLMPAAIARQLGLHRNQVRRVLGDPDGHKLLPDRRSFSRSLRVPEYPVNHSRPPALLVRDMRSTGRRRWWPGVSDRCAVCNGFLVAALPTGCEPGYVSCMTCSREPWEIVP